MVGKPIASSSPGSSRARTTPSCSSLGGSDRALIADGTYGKLLEKWSLGDNGVEKVLINAGQ
jgi:hypothetical protein